MNLQNRCASLNQDDIASLWAFNYLQEIEEEKSNIILIKSLHNFPKDIFNYDCLGMITNASKEYPVQKWLNDIVNGYFPDLPENIYIITFSYFFIYTTEEIKNSVYTINIYKSDEKHLRYQFFSQKDFIDTVISKIKECYEQSTENEIKKGLVIWCKTYNSSKGYTTNPLLFIEFLSNMTQTITKENKIDEVIMIEECNTTNFYLILIGLTFLVIIVIFIIKSLHISRSK